MGNKFENDKFSIEYFPEESLVDFSMKDQEIDVSDIILMHEIVLGFAKGNKYGTVFSAQSFFSISAEARKEGGQPKYNEFVIVQGFVVHNLAQRLLGNFIMKFHSGRKQIRLFSNHQEARKWVKGRIKAHKSVEAGKLSGLVL